MQNENGLTFNEFMTKVDVAMNRILGGMGIDHNEIADWDYWSAWDAGMKPADAAQEALDSDDLYRSIFG